jgi:DHA1 family bicyclomycin/chloramphenicol resistance-like MFS transporter
MHSTVALAVTSAALMLVGLVAWYGVRRSITA